MPRTGCKACRSPNIEKYEELWSKGATFLELEEIAKTQNKEDLSNMAFWRHMTKCVPLKSLNSIPDPDYLTQKEESALDSLTSLREAKGDLESIIKIAEGVFKNKPTAQTLTALATAFDRKRSYIESIDRLEKERQVATKIDEKVILETLLWATEFMCPECSKEVGKQVTERLKHGNMGASPKT